MRRGRILNEDEPAVSFQNTSNAAYRLINAGNCAQRERTHNSVQATVCQGNSFAGKIEKLEVECSSPWMALSNSDHAFVRLKGVKASDLCGIVVRQIHTRAESDFENTSLRQGQDASAKVLNRLWVSQTVHQSWVDCVPINGHDYLCASPGGAKSGGGSRSIIRFEMSLCRSSHVSLVIGVGLSLHALAQDPAVFRVETRIVEVTIIATDRDGRPVQDLTLDEIELLDNGKAQRIQSFAPIGSYGEALAQPPGGPAAKAARHTVLLLDALNTNFTDQAFVRAALAKVFRDFVADQDRLAVFLLSNQLKMLHDFTDDAVSLEALASAMSGEAAAGDVRADAADNETANFTLEDIFNNPDSAPNRVAADYLLQRRVLSTLEALSNIAKGLADIPGQKNLIWLSAGFPLESWSATRNPAGGASTIGRSQNFQRDAERMTNELNAANMNLYPVDARGLSLSPRAHVNIGVMQQFAEETGGKAYANTNDLARSVRSAIDDSRIGYVLTYSPDNYGEEGTRHTIKIKTSRRGIELRYRPGYSAK